MPVTADERTNASFSCPRTTGRSLDTHRLDIMLETTLYPIIANEVTIATTADHRLGGVDN